VVSVSLKRLMQCFIAQDLSCRCSRRHLPLVRRLKVSRVAGCHPVVGSGSGAESTFRPLLQVPFDADGVPFGNWTAARSWDMEAYGLAAVDFQLGQLYYGVQLAIALRRTLILPKVRRRRSGRLMQNECCCLHAADVRRTGSSRVCTSTTGQLPRRTARGNACHQLCRLCSEPQQTAAHLVRCLASAADGVLLRQQLVARHRVPLGAHGGGGRRPPRLPASVRMPLRLPVRCPGADSAPPVPLMMSRHLMWSSTHLMCTAAVPRSILPALETVHLE
jgi:hypothetical protein